MLTINLIYPFLPQDLPTPISKKGKIGSFDYEIEPNNTTNSSITWTSSNPSVATVDANGQITAVGSGTATITIKYTIDGKEYSSILENMYNRKVGDKIEIYYNYTDKKRPDAEKRQAFLFYENEYFGKYPYEKNEKYKGNRPDLQTQI